MRRSPNQPELHLCVDHMHHAAYLRAQVPGFRPDGRRYSLLEYLLRETEQVRAALFSRNCWLLAAGAAEVLAAVLN